MLWTPAPSGIPQNPALGEKRLCCAGSLGGLALLGEVIERLQRVVPFKAYCASTKDPASGLITHALAEEMGGADEAAIFFERLYFEHHQSVRRITNTHQSVALLSETTGGDLERPTRYVEYLRPLGLTYEMRGARRTREARRAWPLHVSDFSDAFYFRAYRPEPSPQRLREGRGAQPGRACQMPFLRQPVSDTFQVGTVSGGSRRQPYHQGSDD